MPTLRFELDKDRDIRNAWELCNIQFPWAESKEKMPLKEDYKSLWKGKDFDECREEIWNSIKVLYSSGIIEAFRIGVEKSWAGINQKYFSRLEKVTGRQIYTDSFTTYMTSVGRCPYNPEDNSFMISIKRPLLQCLRTSGHELMHLQFHHYFWEEISKKIGNAKAADLNESLTVLLNSEFRDLWMVEDTGYPTHQRLRGFIGRTWKEVNDFDLLLKKCVEYIKTN